jgi:hypothetical protein
MGIFSIFKEEFEFQKRIWNKKNKKPGQPKYFIFEQPGTKVLLLPAKFSNHSVFHPVFSVEEQKELAKLFKHNRVAYYTYDEVTSKFVCNPISVGDAFYADKNDLNNIPGEVCEFEFHKKTT